MSAECNQPHLVQVCSVQFSSVSTFTLRDFYVTRSLQERIPRGNREIAVIEFASQYRMRAENQRQCKIRMNGQIMEEVNEFKYLGSILCKYGSMDGEIRERATQGRKVIGSLGQVMRERTVSRKVKKALRDSIIVPTVAYASETWVWNQSQKSKIQATEMSYLRGRCGVNRMDGESNENVERKSGMSSRGKGMSCGVMEMVKRSSLR